jgi:hypothetical protein
VTSSTSTAYREVKKLVGSPLGKELGEAPPDRPIVVDLWLDHGNLSAAEIDVLQFADGAKGRVAVRLEVTTGTPIAAPAGAVKLDPAELLGE